MWLDQKLAAVLPEPIKQKLIGYYKLIRRSPGEQPQPVLTEAEVRRLNLMVWALVGLATLALLASLVIPTGL